MNVVADAALSLLNAYPDSLPRERACQWRHCSKAVLTLKLTRLLAGRAIKGSIGAGAIVPRTRVYVGRLVAI